jgi:signal transduction histidine kinase/integral membrane sensor domain MASE1
MILKDVLQQSIFIRMLHIIGLAAAYFIAGKFGHLLAIPPGYASAIFPPSGIALAGILLYGNRAGWGILIGAFLLNALIFVVAENLSESLNSTLVSLAIACGATLQALVGAYLLKRFAGFPNGLDNQKSIFSFMFYGGVMSALVNSTLSVSLLVAIGRMPAETFLLNWLSWWGGDALGIIVFVPLVLVWMSPHNPAWRHRGLAITVPISTMFFLTVFAIFYEIDTRNTQIKMDFEQQAKHLSATLKSSITIQLSMLQLLNSLYASSENVTEKEFNSFSELVLNSSTSVLSIGFAPIIHAGERANYEKNLQLEGRADFQIAEMNTHKKLVRAENRPEYAPIRYVKPDEATDGVRNFDLYSTVARREAIARARDTGEISMTRKVTLVQNQGGYSGVVAYLPIYHNELPHNNLTERRQAISGYLFGAFRSVELVSSAFKNQNLEGLSYRLIDENAPIAEQILFASDEQEFKPFVVQEKGLFSDTKTFFSRAEFLVAGRVWRFEIVPTPNYFIQYRSVNVWLILFAGILLTLITTVFSLISSGRKHQLQQMVDNRTEELIVTNEKLAALNEEFAITNEELILQNYEKEQRAAELVIANKELAFQNTERKKRATELVNANEKLAFENTEKEQRAAELVVANEKLEFQNTAKERRAMELIIANEELAFQNVEKEKRAVELIQSHNQNSLLNSQVNQMQKLESIGRLTSGIAHDFNNILACMLGFNEMNTYISEDIIDSQLKIELEKNTKQISDAGQRAVTLIKKMMTYSRQDTHQESVDVKPTQEVINEVVGMLRPALTSRVNLKVELKCNDDIQIDAIDLHQILTNLAVNARDAMKERGGVMTIALNTLTILNAQCVACAEMISGDFIELSVSDNGTGIDSTVIHRIFDPFFTTKAVGEGTGLGLSTVIGMVHSSHGHVLIDSDLTEESHGTTFRLFFPQSLENV